METGKIHIALICDSNYLIPTKTLINSIRENKDENDKVNIHIIGVGLLEEDVVSIKNLSGAFVKIDVIIPEEQFKDINIVHQHVSKAALYKMLLPKLLNNIDKVIYLDSDMLVLGSLQCLYNTDISGIYAGVVKDYFAEKNKLYKTTATEMYFNSGMMLLNLKKMRDESISEKLLTARSQDTSTDFMDQNTFNNVFAGNVICLSPIYNYMLTISAYELDKEKVAEVYDISVNDAKMLEQAAIVLHYTNKSKPWNKLGVTKWETWFRYICREDIVPVLDLFLEEYRTADYYRNILLFIKKQEQSSREFIKDRKSMDWTNLNPMEEKIFNAKEELVRDVKKILEDKYIVIYGAGKIGQLVYKLLYEANLDSRILGFAVSNEEENVAYLFDKKVQQIKKYEKENCYIIYALRNEEYVAEISSGYKILKIMDYVSG